MNAEQTAAKERSLALAWKTPTVPALDRAVLILETLSESSAGLTLSQLSRRLRLPKSSVHCLLCTLARHGLVHRRELSNQYVLAPRHFALATNALQGIKLREQALPVLRALCHDTRLTVHMAILEHNEVYVIEKIEPAGFIRVASWVGKRLDAHCTSVGKALIAYLAEDQLQRLLESHGLMRYNHNTIVSVPKLKEELALVRVRGYAVDDEEEELGMRCVGAPVFGSDSRAVAAVSVTGTTAEINSQNLGELANCVKKAAAEISEQVGTVGPSKRRTSAAESETLTAKADHGKNSVHLTGQKIRP